MRVAKGIILTLTGTAVFFLGLWLHGLPSNVLGVGKYYSALNTAFLFSAVVGGIGAFAGLMLTIFAIEERVRQNKIPKHIGLEQIDQMSGEEFEAYLQQLFIKEGATASKTKQSRDYGADLLLEIEGRSVAVQVKRYSEKVGVSAVQEVATARTYYKTDEAWIVTNNYFTQSARELAVACNVRLFDRVELKRLIA